MEFRLDENTFMMYVRDIERELAAEQNAFNKNENVEAIRRKHEVKIKKIRFLLYLGCIRNDNRK